MTLPGETVATGAPTICECGIQLQPKVCQSAAGYYIGYWCDHCGPWTRESGYYRDRTRAQADLDNGEYCRP